VFSMIYVVLGMHKSGTSFISQTLHHSGINMVDEVNRDLSYDQGNKYERESTKALNQEILCSEGIHSLNLSLPEKLSVTKDQQERMQSLIEDYDERFDSWGFKDPRTCFTYPFWEKVLPRHKLIVVYRPIEELWKRYRRSRKVLFPLNAIQLVKRWYEHNARIVKYLQQTNIHYLILDYSLAMREQTEFNRLQRFVGARLNDERDTRLYRGRGGKYIFLTIAKRLYYIQRKRSVDEMVRHLNVLRLKQ